MNYTLNNVNTFFELPISYNDKKMKVSDNIKTDLELLDIKNNKSLYNSIFTNKNKYATHTSDLWNEYYSYDKKFLKDTQNLLKKKFEYNISNLECWDIIKGNDDFNDSYSFFSWNILKFINNNSLLLQIFCLYKFISPIFSLIYPIFMLFIPFFILKYYNKIDIPFANYWNFMKIIICNNALIKFFREFSLTKWRETVWSFFSAGMYIFGIYQNIISCIHFHKNMNNINSYIIELTQYIKNEIKLMNSFHLQCEKLTSYTPFIDNMNKHKETLLNVLNHFETVTKYSWNFHNLSHMGHSMKTLYFIYYDKSFHDAIMYSFGFNGYILNIKDIQNNIKSQNISKAIFSKNTKFKQAYYPIFKNKKHVKNDYSIDKNLIISGPNASGKTTLIKTTLFNILLSQQIGYGFYKSGNIKIYKYLHSYLNIPDTSDRDSLFQAEARRCREIISLVDKNKKDTHFCIFDELYSGTNPYEANASAFAFIKYLSKNNIDFMLTTHFVELCENLNKKEKIKNTQMDISINNDKITYLYKLINGISKHKGGVHVLKQLQYPEEIIKDTNQYLSNNY